MKKIILIVLFAAFYASVASFAQSTTVKKTQSSMSVSIDIDDENGEEVRKFEIEFTDENGDEGKLKWKDSGKIPQDVLKQLKEAGITVIDGDKPSFTMGESDENVVEKISEIHVVKTDDGQKNVIIQTKEGMGEEVMLMIDDEDLDMDGGKVIIMDSDDFTWSSDGEMSDEVKEAMKKVKMKIKASEHDGDGKVMFFSKDDEDHGDHKKVIKIKKSHMMGEHDGDDNVWISKDVKKKGIVKIIDDNGTEKTIEWDGESEMPEEMRELLDDHDIEIEGIFDDIMEMESETLKINDMSFQVDYTNQAVMGAMIENDDNGVRVTDVMQWSGAEEAGLKRGDIITEIDGKEASDMKALLQVLRTKEPGDKVKVKYLRKGKSESAKVLLKAAKKG